MFRVLFYTGSAVLLCSAALIYLPSCFSLIAAIAFAVMAVIFLIFCIKFKLFKAVIAFALLSAFCITGYITVSDIANPASFFGGYKARITGTVTENPQFSDDGGAVYYIKTESINLYYNKKFEIPNKIPQKIKIRLNDNVGDYLELYDKATMDITFNELGEYRTSSLSSGVYASGNIERIILNYGKNRPFYAVFSDFRSFVEDKFYTYLDKDDAAFASAILLGDKSCLSESLNSQVKTVGISHVLVVSGMHLGIIFQIFGFAFSMLGLSKRLTAGFQLFVVFAVSAVCGFTPSIMRAGLTYAVVSLGTMFYYKSDPLNSLGFAAIVSCFLNPFLFFNVSAMLSFASTFGLLFVCPVFFSAVEKVLKRRYTKPLKALTFAFIQTVTATFFTLPIIICYFGYVSVISPVTNILVDYAATVLVCLLLISAITFCFPFFSVIPFLTVTASKWIIRYICHVTDKLSHIDGAVAPAGKNLLLPWIILLAAMALFAALSVINKKRFKIPLSAVCAVTVVVSFITGYLAVNDFKSPSVRVLKTGDGLCTIVNTGECSVIVGAGDYVSDSATVQNALLQSGKTKADVLLLPSLDRNVAGGAQSIVKNTSFKAVLYPDNGDFFSEFTYLGSKNKNIIRYKESADFYVGRKCRVYCFDKLGAVINTDKKSVIIYIGTSGAERLYKRATAEKKQLICLNDIPVNLDLNSFSDIAVCAQNEKRDKLYRVVRSYSVKNVRFNDKHTVVL